MINTTWHQLRAQCLEHFKSDQSYANDSIAKREFWHLACDDLREIGLISQRQRDTWSCPF